MKEFVDFGVLILLYFLVFFKKWKRKRKDRIVINTIMYVYLSFVLYFTLMPIITSIPTALFNHHFRAMNLVPFIDVAFGRGDFIRQIVLNVIMTVPFGFLLPLLKDNRGFIKVIFYTFLLSLSIELLQPLINGFRSSDITDIITNVMGGAIGYFLYLLLKPLTAKIITFLKKK